MALTLTLAMALATAAAQDAMPAASAPQAPPDALYCLRVEAATGTRLETVQCWTRDEWAENEVDVDKDWAKEGVAVLDPHTRQPIA